MITGIKYRLLLSSILVSMAGCGGGSDEKTPTDESSVTTPRVATSVIKKTGQTKSYDASGNEVTDGSVKDDGYYQRGVSRSYTRDDENSTVTDNVTGLMWQDDGEAASVTKPWLTSENSAACSDDTSSDVCYNTNGETASSYCDALSLGGYTDWRLPTVKELKGLVDYGKTNSAISITFENITSSHYWSSTTDEEDKDFAWYVRFDSGYVYDSNKSDNHYVRCVRTRQ